MFFFFFFFFFYLKTRNSIAVVPIGIKLVSGQVSVKATVLQLGLVQKGTVYCVHRPTDCILPVYEGVIHVSNKPKKSGTDIGIKLLPVMWVFLSAFQDTSTVHEVQQWHKHTVLCIYCMAGNDNHRNSGSRSVNMKIWGGVPSHIYPSLFPVLFLKSYMSLFNSIHSLVLYYCIDT